MVRPRISVLSDAALILYGTTMLIAAGRRYRGCEVLTISNWLLDRNDQVGCLLFEPIDRIKGHHRPAISVPHNAQHQVDIITSRKIDSVVEASGPDDVDDERRGWLRQAYEPRRVSSTG